MGTAINQSLFSLYCSLYTQASIYNNIVYIVLQNSHTVPPPIHLTDEEGTKQRIDTEKTINEIESSNTASHLNTGV